MREDSQPASAEQRLKDLGYRTPGAARTVRHLCGSGADRPICFFSPGCFPQKGPRREICRAHRCRARRRRWTQKQLTSRRSTGLAVARKKHLGSLDKVTRIVRLGVSVATSGDVSRSTESRGCCFGLTTGRSSEKEKNPCRLVYGVASLPLGTPVELEIIFRG